MAGPNVLEDAGPAADPADGKTVPEPLTGRVEEAVAAERAARTLAAGRRACRYCGGALPPGKRADALDCSPDHRTRYHRERVAAEIAAARDSGPVRLEQAQAVLGPLADQIAAAAADPDRVQPHVRRYTVTPPAPDRSAAAYCLYSCRSTVMRLPDH
ncbi:hypothetical protein AB0B45_49650 [Nonomuraea sp. NPDC049152]|uniref:hypothetical protein n=1 Tax=Nonomuraea sp. NPDC049152 TaxID=3154350 RepID=UPI0033C75581